MGYYTDYVLSAYRYPADADLKAVSAAIRHIDGGIFEEWNDEEWHSYAKWHSQDEDMYTLSIAFPHILFALHGNGEDADDLWIEYWKNGSMQHCHAEIPPYDNLQMVPYYLDEGGQLCYGSPPDEPNLQNIKLPDL